MIHEGHSVRCLGHVGGKFLAVLVLILTDPTLARVRSSGRHTIAIGMVTPLSRQEVFTPCVVPIRNCKEVIKLVLNRDVLSDL